MNYDILTDSQLCEWLEITPRTARDWRDRRGLPHYKITSKVIRYQREAVMAWLERMRTAHVCGGAK